MKKNSRKHPPKPRRLPRFTDPRLSFPVLDGGGHASMPVQEAAQVTGCSVRTVNRWRRARRVPAAPLRLLQLHHAGLIVPPDWRRIGALFSRLGELQVGSYAFRPCELEGYGVMLQALRALQLERETGKPATQQRPLLVVLPGGAGRP